MEYHRNTTEKNIIKNTFLYLDRKRDKNYDSQIRYYCGYEEKDHTLNETDVLILNMETGEVFFFVDKKGRGQFTELDTDIVKELYKELKRYRKEIKRGLREKTIEENVISKDELVPISFMVLGYKETMKNLPDDIDELFIPQTLTKRSRYNMKLHKKKNIRKVFLYGDGVKILTLPDSVERLSTRPDKDRPVCVDKHKFTLLHRSVSYMKVYVRTINPF